MGAEAGKTENFVSCCLVSDQYYSYALCCCCCCYLFVFLLGAFVYCTLFDANQPAERCRWSEASHGSGGAPGVAREPGEVSARRVRGDEVGHNHKQYVYTYKCIRHTVLLFMPVYVPGIIALKLMFRVYFPFLFSPCKMNAATAVIFVSCDILNTGSSERRTWRSRVVSLSLSLVTLSPQHARVNNTSKHFF